DTAVPAPSRREPTLPREVPLGSVIPCELASPPPAETVSDDYAVAFYECRDRLLQLISGFEAEERESAVSLDACQGSLDTLRFHLERIDRIQSTGGSRGRMIREYERGLVAIDAAEQELRGELEHVDRVLPSQRDASPAVAGLFDQGFRRGMIRAGGFFLPPILFVFVAVVLILTAFGLI
ncbi:MAG: hypothetical protein AAGJ31_11460, partial [Verrucomicrobiota bacterium]